MTKISFRLSSLLTLIVFIVACGEGQTHTTNSSSGDNEDWNVGDQLECESPEEECSNRCVDTSSSVENCGACGDACAPGDVCSDGECQLFCPSNLSECDGGCFDTDYDPRHCGACGNTCNEGQACLDGTCSAGSCSVGLEECDGSCKDIQLDPDHCGSCGNSCDSDQACVAGSCTFNCPGSQQICGSACRDIMTHPSHCGSCNSACNAGEVCMEGNCTTSCGAGLTECNQACVDLDSNPSYCGGCDNSCTSGPNASGVCLSGECEFVCHSGYNNCDGDADTGCETIGSCAFRYQRIIEVNNPGPEKTDFQVQLTLNTTSSVNDGKMRPDCGDLRVFDADAMTPLSYWVEGGCGTNETVIWVKIPHLDATDTRNLYIRYGDTTAESQSDGPAVFEVFDDFSVDTEAEYTLHSHPSWSGGQFNWITGSEVLRTDTSNNDFFLTRDGTDIYEEDVWVEVRAFPRDNDGVGSAIWGGDEDFYTCITNNDYPDRPILTEKLISITSLPTEHGQYNILLDFGNLLTPQNNWSIISMAYDGGFLHCAFNYIRQSATHNIGSSLEVAGWGLASYANDPAADYDWFRIRKFAPVQPTATVGDEVVRY